MHNEFEIIKYPDHIRIRKLTKPFAGDWFDMLTEEEAEELRVKLNEFLIEVA